MLPGTFDAYFTSLSTSYVDYSKLIPQRTTSPPGPLVRLEAQLLHQGQRRRLGKHEALEAADAALLRHCDQPLHEVAAEPLPMTGIVDDEGELRRAGFNIEVIGDTPRQSVSFPRRATAIRAISRL